MSHLLCSRRRSAGQLPQLSALSSEGQLQSTVALGYRVLSSATIAGLVLVATTPPFRRLRRMARQPRLVVVDRTGHQLSSVQRAVITVDVGCEVAEGCEVDEEVEKRYNPWDGRVYTIEELRRVFTRSDATEEELQQHWNDRCTPLVARLKESDDVQPEGNSFTPPQVQAWRNVWTVNSISRIWTSADAGHVHAFSGGLYTLLGVAYMLDTSAHDIAALNGISWEQHVPFQVVLVTMAFGAINALSGLQPALLSRSLTELPYALGFGPEESSVRSGGFVNCSLFYLLLTYQSLRVLPFFPVAISPLLDPFVGLVSIMAMLHTIFILNRWVEKKSMHRVDALLVPPLLNLPVTLHLLFQGQTWVEQLSSQYAGWPEAFFFANYALAFAASMVTFALSMHERRVTSSELRGLLMVAVPLLVFATILMHTAVLVPEWFHDDWHVMLTLNPIG